ncbi:MAG: hypothetical protein Q4A62_06690 [Eikenella sp.]|nr:hypothetical protein [Eikenella sp.]
MFRRCLAVRLTGGIEMVICLCAAIAPAGNLFGWRVDGNIGKGGRSYVPLIQFTLQFVLVAATLLKQSDLNKMLVLLDFQFIFSLINNILNQ